MPPIEWGRIWWSSFWLRLPVLLVLLAGAIATLVTYMQQRRRTASCLGALGFTVLLIFNVVGSLVPLWIVRTRISGEMGPRMPALLSVGGLFLNLFTAMGFILLLVALLVENHRQGGEA